MLVLTPKYGSQIDLDLLKKQKSKTKESLITHRNDIIYLTHCQTIEEAYLAFLDNKGKYFIGYKPKTAEEINKFVKSLGLIDTLNVSWIDVSHLENLVRCFDRCQAIHIVGLEKWDVSNVEDMYCMFLECYNLESVGDISGWDVSNVKTMNYMFYECENLESIGDISNWNVSNVQSMDSMFSFCKNIESIGDLSRWDVSTVNKMEFMFNECKKLESVGDLERWKLQNGVDTERMFQHSAIKPIPSWY